MTMSEPRLNSTASAQRVVTEADLASALRFEPGDDFPTVFATARLVALMEVAAARCLIPHLQAGEMSVGVTVHPRLRKGSSGYSTAPPGKDTRRRRAIPDGRGANRRRRTRRESRSLHRDGDVR